MSGKLFSTVGASSSASALHPTRRATGAYTKPAGVLRGVAAPSPSRRLDPRCRS